YSASPYPLSCALVSATPCSLFFLSFRYLLDLHSFPTRRSSDLWLHSRNIDLSNGKKVVLYSTISHEPITRKEFKVQLERNRKQMEKWKERKKEVLGLFKGGIVSSV